MTTCCIDATIRIVYPTQISKLNKQLFQLKLNYTIINYNYVAALLCSKCHMQLFCLFDRINKNVVL